MPLIVDQTLRWVPAVITLGAGLLVAGVAGAAPDVPRRFSPGPWLTDVRVLGPEAHWSGVFPKDPDLPSLSVRAGQHGRRVDARQTAFRARSALEHPLPEWWQSVPVSRSFAPVPSLDPDQLRADTLHLQQWFRDRGWLDCRVRLELAEDDSVWGRWLNRRAPGAARRATFVVDTAERWSVRAWHLDGLDQVEPSLRRVLTAAVEVAPGAYDGEARARTEASLARLLSGAGFSHPLVDSVLVPDGTTRTLTLLFQIEPGERAVFGPLDASGLPEATVERLTRRVQSAVPEGAPWQGDKLDAVEASLGRIPSFARVEVSPGERNAALEVPVVVSVSESETDGLYPILTLASEPTLYAMEAGLGYRSSVVGRQLATFEVRGAAGYRSLPMPVGEYAFWGNHGPSGELGVSSDLFLLPLAGLSLVAEAEGDLEPVQANNTLTFAFRTGIRTRPTPHLEVTLTPEVALWRSFAWSAQQDLWEEWFVEPGDPPLPPMLGRHRPSFRPFAPGTLVRMQLRWMDVDQPMLPTSGGDLRVDAVPLGLAGTDRFWRLEASARRYIAMGSERWVFVPRVDMGVLRFADPTVASVPQLRFYLGGGNSLRGWGVARANPPGWDGDVNDYRIGGNVLGLASMELRFAVWPRLHVFAFSDTGRTWEGVVDRVDRSTGVVEPGVRMSTLLPAAGLGLALPTPVGRAAMSGALRLREDTELVHSPSMATFHFILVQSY